jgi:glycosyltransferase involved in cell wall biosynthesis
MGEHARLRDQRTFSQYATSDEFVEIAERLMDRVSGLGFVVVGDAPDDYEGAHTRLVRGMRATTRAAFVFHRTVPYADMPALYRRAAVSGGALVSTSPYESHPMNLLEAMACRCPVLSTDVGGLRDVVADGVTGRLYAPGDVAGAVAILAEMLSSRGGAATARMTGRARRQILRRHSPRVVAAQYRALLDAVREGRGGDAGRAASLSRDAGRGRSV